MLGSPRLARLLESEARGDALIDYLLHELAAFAGPDSEQEDDVTLLTLDRLSA